MLLIKDNNMDYRKKPHKYHSWFCSLLDRKVKDVNATTHKYNKMRNLTELWFMYREYLPIVYINNESCNKLIVVIYESIQRMYNDIDNELLFLKRNYDKSVDEKKRIINILLEEMRNVEDLIIPLLPNTYTATHFVRSVIEYPMKIKKSANHTFFVYDYE
jgi:hypothetical protein